MQKKKERLAARRMTCIIQELYNHINKNTKKKFRTRKEIYKVES